MIKRLVQIDKRWIPKVEGYSLYIRPTMIGTRACSSPLCCCCRYHLHAFSALGVRSSDRALLFVILSPTGPYFPTGPKPISLLAVDEHVRAWPGGTGAFKLGSNYAPGFMPQNMAAAQGYEQVLWLFGEGKRIMEMGAMNFFAVMRRDDGGRCHDFFYYLP